LQHNIIKTLSQYIQQLDLKQLHAVSTKPEAKDDLLVKILETLEVLTEKVEKHEERLDGHDKDFEDLTWLDKAVVEIRKDHFFNEYYIAFNAFWNSAFTAAEAQNSGKVAMKTDSIFSSGGDLPYIGPLCSFFGWVHSKVKENKMKFESNKLLNFESVGHTRQKLIQELVVKIVRTEERVEEINAKALEVVSEGVINKIKKILDGEDLYNTPVRILALRDATFLMKKVFDNSLDAKNIMDHAPQVLEVMSKQAVIKANSKGKSCTIMAVKELEIPFMDLVLKGYAKSKALGDIILEHAPDAAVASEMLKAYDYEQELLGHEATEWS